MTAPFDLERLHAATASDGNVGQAFFSPREVAGACGVNYEFILEMIKDGRIPGEKFGRRYMVPAWWLREHQFGSREPLVVNVARVEPEPKTAVVAPDFGPLATVMEVLSRVLLEAANELRGGAA